MDLGLLFIGSENVRDTVTITCDAEKNGFASVRVAESYRSGWVPLTAMAAATKTIRLGPHVLNAYARSPFMAGLSAIDFNELSGGRLIMGVGGGNRIVNESWQGIPHARVLTKMREYVTLLQRMARTQVGEELVYDGDIHQMNWTPAVAPRAEPFPVYLAAVFPRMVRVAAQTADGLAAGVTISPAYLRDVLKPQAAEAAGAVERDPGSLAWAGTAMVAIDEDREAARHAAREAICHLYAPLPHPYYEFTMREQGFGVVVDQLIKHMPAGDLEAAVAAIPDDCLDTLAIAGTVEECRDRLSAYDGIVDEMVLMNVMPPAAGDAQASYASLMTLPRTFAKK